MHLEEKEKKELLRLARSSIREALGESGDRPESMESPNLLKPAGVFVTLRQEKDLRGCIGYVEARLPLVKAVEEVAVKAATEDPRFLPITLRELDATEIEISVLSPLVRLHEPLSIKVGTHGLVIDAGYARGLLLPGVATEYHWTAEQFLDHTAAKAGLSPGIWRTNRVQIYSFTTTTFCEHEYSQAR